MDLGWGICVILVWVYVGLSWWGQDELMRNIQNVHNNVYIVSTT